MELRLMNHRGEFVKSVNIEEENVLIIINVVSGDWVMVEPYIIDTDCDDTRNLSVYDGVVKFLATKKNIDKVNEMKSPFELFDAFGEDELNEGWA